MSTQIGRTGRKACGTAALYLGLCGALFGSTAIADTIELSGLVSASTEGKGKFGATIEYTANGGDLGTLTVSLYNASCPTKGGFLTGFLFNFVSSDPTAKATLQPGAAYPFLAASGNGMPFGQFKAGAALGGNFQGGGNPNNGIPPGATGIFIFTIQASDAATLSASHFVEGPNAYDFVVRFKGFTGGWSDKVPGVVPCPCDLNYDGVITSADVQVVLDAWGPANGSNADRNGDGQVDAVDLGLVLGCWRACAAQ